MTDQEITHKQKLALVTLIKELKEQLNEVYTLKKAGESYETSLQVLREMALIPQYIPPHLQEEYFRMLPVLFPGDARRREVTYSPEYTERSVGSKRRFIAEISHTLSAAPSNTRPNSSR